MKTFSKALAGFYLGNKLIQIVQVPFFLRPASLDYGNLFASTTRGCRPLFLFNNRERLTSHHLSRHAEAGLTSGDMRWLTRCHVFIHKGHFGIVFLPSFIFMSLN